MRFEVSERIETDHTPAAVLSHALIQFQKVSKKAKLSQSGNIIADSIEATFGSISRSDRTVIRAKPAQGGVLLVAEVDYRPSFVFWILLIVLLFTWVGWLIPIAFYLIQKSAVRNAIESCLQRVKDECSRSTNAAGVLEPKPSALDELRKLADLKDRGALSEEEFSHQKMRLLRAR